MSHRPAAAEVPARAHADADAERVFSSSVVSIPTPTPASTSSSVTLLVPPPAAASPNSPTSPTSPSATSLTNFVEAIGQLYKSKLSLSLRTVQLRRLMREQFLSDLHHPSDQQSADDAEIARWIASSALSQLEIEDEQQQREQGGDGRAAADGDAAAASDASQSPPQDSPTASPVDLSIRHTPVLAPRAPAPDAAQTVHITLAESSHSTPLSPIPSPAASTATSDGASSSAFALPVAPSFPTSVHSPLSGTSFSPPPPSVSEVRSTTPIINSEDPNISQLIGSGFNTKRGSTFVPVRRSSTSDPIKGSMAAAAAAAAAANTAGTAAPPQWVSSKPRGAPTTGSAPPVPNSTSPVLTSSLPPSGRTSPQPSLLPIPLTAFALVSDQPSSTRAVSHPPAPAGVTHNNPDQLVIPPSGAIIARSISDNKPKNQANSVPNSRRHSRIYFTLSPPVTELLHSAWQWEFDLFAFVEQVPDTPLTTITCYLLERWDIFNTFNIDRATFHRFISAIESGYKDNAYHNKVHAADVVQNIHVLLLGFHEKPSKDSAGGLCTSLTPLDVFASIVAAACHDFKHDGVSNLFHTNTMSELSIRYNDVSVLENMHVAETFSLISRHKECDIFASLSKDQRREIRETIITMVLATDMKHHIAMLTDLQANIEQKKSQGIWFDVSSRSDRLLLLKNCLHLSDVANPTKPTPTCVKWADAIVQEWFSQGDQERALKIDISPMMDRSHSNEGTVAKSQIGFSDFFIEPLYTTWAKITPLTSIPLEYLRLNRTYWVNRENAYKEKAAAVAAAAAATSNTNNAPNTNTNATAPTQTPAP